MERGAVYSEWKPTIEAAFENFQDGNVLELLDTIVRIVKIASRKRTSSLRTRTSKRVKLCPAVPRPEKIHISAPAPPLENQTFQENYEEVTPRVVGGENEVWKHPGMRAGVPCLPRTLHAYLLSL